MGRYDGKPFLKLADSFFLDVIGELDESQTLILSRMNEKLGALYNIEGGWREVVRSQLDLSDEFISRFKSDWISFRDSAQSKGAPADPYVFVAKFVDARVENKALLSKLKSRGEQ